MASDAEILRPASLARRRAEILRPRWTAAAWASIGLVTAFVCITCWWLSKDRSIPIDDAGVHLANAIDAYEALASGHLLKALTESTPYPPLAYLVGAVGVLFGGVRVAPPIIALNVVFVPLLALGSYNVARLAFGSTAGLLAVVFVLGSPMIIEEFHEFMLDAPEAAMVAIAVWAILATERFSRPRVSILAGIAVGLGMLSKETFVFFVAGVALATAVRGGRRSWRGVAVFAAAALVVALPWYLGEFSTIHQLEGEALGSPSRLAYLRLPAGIAPPRLSASNFEWYFWNFLNWQLYVPLFAFSAAGFVWTIARLARRRPAGRFAPELVFGAFVAWAALTETYVHDPRYSIPMVLYFAIFAVGWVSQLPRKPRVAIAVVLAAVAFANTLGVGFGVGSPATTAPLKTTYLQQPGTLTFYSNYGFWIGPPERDGDLLGLLRVLRRDGIRDVRWYSEQEGDIEFSPAGITVLARIAGLRVPGRPVDPTSANRSYAFLVHGFPGLGAHAPCIRLHDGAGVWVRRGGGSGVQTWNYCPLRRG